MQDVILQLTFPIWSTAIKSAVKVVTKSGLGLETIKYGVAKPLGGRQSPNEDSLGITGVDHQIRKVASHGYKPPMQCKDCEYYTLMN